MLKQVMNMMNINKFNWRAKTKLLPLMLTINFLAGCVASQQVQRPSPSYEVADNQKIDTKNYNVLFISVDDLNDWVGVLGGHPNASTPNIDRLANRGMLFTNAHTASPVCNSSRAAVMTGLLPSTTGIYRNGVPSKPVVNKNVTISEVYKNNGFYTAGSGKLLHLFNYKKGAWDDVKKRFPDAIADKREVYSVGGEFNIHPLKNNLENETMDARTVSWVIDKLQQPHDKPFFIAAGIYRPHVLWRVPQRFYAEFPEENIVIPSTIENDLDDVGSIGMAWALQGKDQVKDDKADSLENSAHSNIKRAGHWQLGMQAYLASIKHADTQVGRLLDALDTTGLTEKTIIVLWSDHGWHLGEKNHWRKSTLWEESTRVPLIVSVPGLTKANSRSTKLSV